MQPNYKNNPFTPMLICVMLLASILAFGMGISAQSETNGAVTTRPTPSAEGDLKDCSQMLDQSIAETRACGDAKMYLEKLLAVREEQLQREREISAERLVNNQALIKTNQRLEAIKCSTTSYFFSLIKKKSCY